MCITATFGGFGGNCVAKAYKMDNSFSTKALMATALVDIIVGISLIILGALAHHGILFNTSIALPLLIVGVVEASPILGMFLLAGLKLGDLAGKAWKGGATPNYSGYEHVTLNQTEFDLTNNYYTVPGGYTPNYTSPYGN